MNEGWVKIHRRLLDHYRYQNGDWLRLWIHLLLKASHSKYRIEWCGGELFLEPGQLIVGRQSLGRDLKINEHKIDRLLKSMETEQQIEQKTSNRSRLITILNWNRYQPNEQPNKQQVSNSCAADEQQLSTNKKVKNEKTSSVEIDEVVQAWNQTRLPKVVKLSDKRRRNVKARLENAYWVENWKAALDRIARSTDGRVPWTASFDFFVRNDDAVIKAMEGRYDQRSLQTPALVQKFRPVPPPISTDSIK